MTKHVHRKTAPGVSMGKVRNHTRTGETSSYWNKPQRIVVIDKREPGKGFRHFITKRDLQGFIDLLPEWDIVSSELNAIVLSEGEDDSDGWYTESIIGICAWDRDYWRTFEPDFYAEHRAFFSKLGVPIEKCANNYICKFTPAKIRAYQLLHVFLHELGHHYDRITSKRKVESGRGELFAETYAQKYEEIIWNRFVDTFGL